MGWSNTCQWCGDGKKPVTRVCGQCWHVFCEGCWHPRLGCPRCYARRMNICQQAAKAANAIGEELRARGIVR